MSLLSDYAKLGIDLVRISAEYGDQIGFVTGIDTQRGELMSAEEFRQDILRLYSIGHWKPRFVMGMMHMLKYTIPDCQMQMSDCYNPIHQEGANARSDPKLFKDFAFLQRPIRSWPHLILDFSGLLFI